MEKYYCNKEKPHKEKRHRVGIIFLLIGLVLLGKNLNVFPFQLSSILFTWQMLLIAIGLIMVITKRNVCGLVMIAVGGLFLWNKLYPLSPIQWQVAWPGIFIIIGLILIFGYLVKPQKQIKQPETYKKKTNRDDVEFDIDKIEPIES
jgi:membrane-bound ClpP family serine protease